MPQLIIVYYSCRTFIYKTVNSGITYILFFFPFFSPSHIRPEGGRSLAGGVDSRQPFSLLPSYWPWCDSLYLVHTYSHYMLFVLAMEKMSAYHSTFRQKQERPKKEKVVSFGLNKVCQHDENEIIPALASIYQRSNILPHPSQPTYLAPSFVRNQQRKNAISFQGATYPKPPIPPKPKPNRVIALREKRGMPPLHLDLSPIQVLDTPDEEKDVREPRKIHWKPLKTQKETSL